MHLCEYFIHAISHFEGILYWTFFRRILASGLRQREPPTQPVCICSSHHCCQESQHLIKLLPIQCSAARLLLLLLFAVQALLSLTILTSERSFTSFTCSLPLSCLNTHLSIMLSPLFTSMFVSSLLHILVLASAYLSFHCFFQLLPAGCSRGP